MMVLEKKILFQVNSLHFVNKFFPQSSIIIVIIVIDVIVMHISDEKNV